MPNWRRCLGGCGTLITHGSYCRACTKGTGWGQGRDRKTQQAFRDATLARDGHRCTFVEAGIRCAESNPRKLVAHHKDDGTGRTLCTAHHAVVDNHARTRRPR